ncbi:hypothetical protein BASA60_009078 [Batrachochytrium salamandrivorans]|nr:hypothetical protein BASA60_009078 [Batrachochytrium salamandrivorans]
MDIGRIHIPLDIDPTTVLDKPCSLATAPAATDESTIAPVIASVAVPLGKRAVFSEYVLNPTDYQEPCVFGSPKPLPPIHKPNYILSSLLPSTRSFRRPMKKRDVVKTYVASQAPIACIVTPTIGSTNGSIIESSNGSTIESTVKATVKSTVKSTVTSTIVDVPRITIDYRKTLQPKVMLPFASHPGQTPRKIEIERRKRLYSSYSIGALIIEELNKLKDEGVMDFNPLNGKIVAKEVTASNSTTAVDQTTVANIAAPHSDLEIAVLEENGQSLEVREEPSLPTLSGSSVPSTYQKTNADYASMLSLSLFDNTEFDQRTVNDWLDMSAISDDPTPGARSQSTYMSHERGLLCANAPSIRYAVLPLPARGFNGVDWSDCVAIAFDQTSRKWRVKWQTCDGGVFDFKATNGASGTIHPEEKAIQDSFEQQTGSPYSKDEREEWIDRINLMFLAENPVLFSKRVANAYYERYQMTLKLKLGLYVDCMPIDETHTDSLTAQMNRIMETAGIETKRFKNMQGTLIVDNLVKEYLLDYSRTMNHLVFENEITTPGGYLNYPLIEYPISNFIMTGSGYEKESFPIYDYQESKRSFEFASFLKKVEAIRTLANVRLECDRLANTNLFATNITKTVKIDEFEQLQTQSLQNVKGGLKDGWINILKNMIKTGFKDVGKGWYNIQESNIEVYKISKLKKFMTTANFIMEDSLRSLVLNSLQEYTHLIQSIACQTVIIKATNNVTVVASRGKEPKRPLFMIDLIFKAGRLQYNIDFNAFESSLMTIFDKAISIPENLPQLEPLVLDRIFWASKPTVQTVHYKESSYESEDKTVDEMEQDIEKYTAEWKALDKEIPNHMSLGLFWVNCESLRSAMRKDLSKVILEILGKRTLKLAISISQAFGQDQIRLREKPTNIEDLIELRNYLKKVPDTSQQQNLRIQEMLRNYDVLERHRFECSNEDVRARWMAYGWTKRIEDLLYETELSLAAEESVFYKNLIADQEIFKDRIYTLTAAIFDLSKLSDLSRINEIVTEVNRISTELKEAQELTVLFNSRAQLFNQIPTKYDEIAQLDREFEPYKNLWLTCHDWTRWRDQWMLEGFLNLNAEDVERNLQHAGRTIFKCMKYFKNSPGCLAVATQVKEEVEEFKPYLPLILALRNPGMRDRHWDQLSEELNMNLHPDASFTLSDLLNMNLLDKVDLISKFCDVAGKEFSIESSLDKMGLEWKTTMLDIISYKDTGTFIMKVSEDITRLIDDHIVMTQGMNFSPYKKPFSERINLWESKLRTVQETLEAWMVCQRLWLYLEPIFGSDDIATQLPVESKRFTLMDRTWRRIMSQVKQKPGVIECCSDYKLLDSFRECNKLLELVSKGLSAYLESKRISFPRFFFLSDDELLQILSQTKDPTAVQPHLRKCFENVAALEFAPDNKIMAMYSAEGEKIDFSEPFYPKGPVEEWLLRVEDQMRQSVKRVVCDAISAYTTRQRASWVVEWPGQAVLAASQTFWTAEVTTALKSGTDGLHLLLSQLLSQLQDLVNLVRGELPFLNRLILGDLIVIDVHSRDVVKKLIESNITNDNDFEWISQLRYYWEQDDLRIKIVNANFKYGYEYLGNTGRLVITPLTDRCYLTLTGAMHLGMGGAPAGPAGTGKTETVKDLAKALAKQCVVFNCSDQLDYLAMAKFFKGLASSGAWACFDEFNRIDIEVLSVIAQQISTIQKACVAGQTRFIFEGVDLPLEASNAIFITMNPGYAGRTELPDNLKALFRPVAMMIPNYAMIGEISLFSFGFSSAKVLAEKMVATFKLSSEQLSSQDHYDFGMRAVKTVISTAGNLKREQPTAGEDTILLRALCDCNLPKFLADDVPLFNGIISDLFPGTEQPNINYGELLDVLNRTCEKMALQPQDSFIQKCIQLYETTVVRHGLMLVGPTGGGKTSCLRVLSRSLSSLQGKLAPNGTTFQKVKVNTLNPKSITMGQLYGEFDQQTHEWSDGILSCLMREGVEDTSPDRKWYVFDGPVDAIWVESMNTLLDDNKKLCLSSGEIIKMSSTQTMMFEVQDLAFASPATVSRCGMIYMEPESLGISPLCTSWYRSQETSLGENLSPIVRDKLEPLFSYYLDKSLEFVRKSIKEAVPTTNGGLASSLLKILDSLFKPLANPQGDKSPMDPADFEKVVEPLFIFALVWSVGATGDADGQRKFDIWLRGQISARPMTINIPIDGTVYDVTFSIEKLEWVSWMDLLNSDKDLQISNPGKSDTIIQTVDTVRNSFLIDILLKNGYHVLCTGPTGTGKSVTIQEKLMHGLETHWTPIIINFSSRTSANQIQDLIDSKLEKRRKGVFGPPVGKKFILFIDDLNMPQLDICNAQPPIELLRQWMDCRGWFDRKNIGKFMEVVDISFICAMGPPGGGRNPVTSRFLRHFNLISFVEMENISLKRIFSIILGGFLSKFPPEISKSTDSIVDASIMIYNTIRAELLPTPAKSHYTFNLRDLAKVIQGVLSADIKTVNVETDIVRLWIHECQRVFQDRLVDNIDKTWFKDLMVITMNNKLDVSWDEVVICEPLLYGDYMTPGADPKIYTEVKDLRRLVKLTEEYLDDYNSSSTSPMKLVMFLDAIEHVSRICRIIRQPGGHALLLGVGGSGRQSLSRLAAFMEEFEQFQVEISKNYGQTEWRDDLKKVLFAAGLDGKPTVFLYTDTQIISESNLEDINSILNGGDVPNIYTGEEMDRILNSIRPIAAEQSISGTRENLFALYIQRIRSNLHLIICMSPIGDSFRNRLRMFPSLVNCCTIDWFSTWPEDALRSVAANSISEISDLGSELVIDGIVNLCVFMHESVRERCLTYRSELSRNNYVTPKSYLELLGIYKRLLEKKRNELIALRKRTATGLEKLLNATKEVEILQEELEAMQPMLMQTSQETEYAMKKIAIDKIKGEEIKENVIKEELASSKKAEETKAIAEDAKRDLDEALPALDAAVESLNSLSKNDIIEVRSMQRPPEGVKLVIEAICIMKGIKPKKIDGDKPGKKIDDYWEPGRALLADPQRFLDSLMNFDKDNIAEITIQKIKPYIDSPEFQVSVISRVSRAATSMCQWVRAMEKYYLVSRSVAPKRERLKEAQESLDITLKILSELKKKMREAEVNIKEMEKRYAESVAKKEELSRKVEECNIKLSRAGKLISGLSGERQRWALAVDQFDMRIGNIIGDILLSSGAIAYIGPFTAEYRNLLMQEWIGSVLQLKIPHSENTSLWEALGDNVKLREWEIFGLPKRFA